MIRVKGGARRFRLLMIAGAALLFAGEATAQQCLITGPSVLCGGSVQLCAPAGNYEYMWSGPNGFGDWQQCITVTVPGPYELTMLDLDAWSYVGPCTLVVTNVPESPAITGTDHFCAGQTVQLSGPAGLAEYQWSGPGGFTAFTASVTVGVAGDYELVTRDGTSCWSSPGQLLVTQDAAAPAPTISGVDSVCAGQSVQLSGPAGQTEYSWSGPSGFTASTASVNVSNPGTYALTVRGTGCWSSPGQFVLRQDEPTPTPAITGVDSVCTGQTVELCGPAGLAQYLWSGPSGFSASTACVTVSNPGTYGLTARASGTSCQAASSPFVLRQGSCAPPPPPPPPGARASCPRPVSWWANECTLAEQGGGRFPGFGLAAIGACADARATIFSWVDPRSELCRVLRERHQLRQRAVRQFAAVAANVCAFTTQVPQNGTLVGLDPARELHVDESTARTVGEWITQSDLALARLQGASDKKKDVRTAYRRIIRSGWAINHGIGVGPVCGGAGETQHHAATEIYTDPETLEEELSIEGGMPALELETAAPNPFAGSTRLVYYVADTGGERVELSIYDITGRLIRKLVTAANLSVGPHEVTWDGRGDDGRGVQSGVYFVHGRVGADRVSSTLTLLR